MKLRYIVILSSILLISDSKADTAPCVAAKKNLMSAVEQAKTALNDKQDLVTALNNAARDLNDAANLDISDTNFTQFIAGLANIQEETEKLFGFRGKIQAIQDIYSNALSEAKLRCPGSNLS